MTLPAFSVPHATTLAASSAVLDFPLDVTLATIGGLTVLAIGLAAVAASRVFGRRARVRAEAVATPAPAHEQPGW